MSGSNCFFWTCIQIFQEADNASPRKHQRKRSCYSSIPTSVRLNGGFLLTIPCPTITLCTSVPSSCQWLLFKKWFEVMFSLVAQLVKNLPAMWDTWVQSMGWVDPLGKGRATWSSILAWRISWTVSTGLQKSQAWLNNFHFHFPHPCRQSFLWNIYWALFCVSH